MTDRCQIPGCRADADVDYLGHGVCARHWDQFMGDEKPPGALRKALGIDAGRFPAEESDMAQKGQEQNETPKNTPARKRKPKTPAAATPETTEAAADETTAPAPRGRRRKASTAPETAAEAAKPTKERPPREELVVFAFRLTQTERDAIHATAGPRNATQFVRRVAVAFAREDHDAFRGVVDEARKLRG